MSVTLRTWQDTVGGALVDPCREPIAELPTGVQTDVDRAAADAIDAHVTAGPAE